MKKAQVVMRTALSVVLLGSTALPAFADANVEGEAVGGNRVNTVQSAAEWSGHWAEPLINKWLTAGWVSGYPDGSFRPDQHVSRSEFVNAINTIFGYYVLDQEEPFADVQAGNWYASALSIAREAGYYQGYPNNTAKPDKEITREDAAVLLVRAFGLEKVAGGTDSSTSFLDESDIRSYARESVRVLSGVIEGYPDGSFKPEGALTRAEMLSWLDELAPVVNSMDTSSGRVIQGNVVINQNGIKLSDVVINGNLYIAPGVREGDVDLSEVTVKGATYIQGGGTHSVTVTDSALDNIFVDRREGEVRLELTGTTTTGQLHVERSATVALGSETVVRSAKLSARTTLQLDSGSSVGELHMTKDAKGTSVTGTGKVSKVDIQADGVLLNGKAVTQDTWLAQAGSDTGAASGTVNNSSDGGSSTGNNSGNGSGGVSNPGNGGGSGGGSDGNTGGNSGGGTTTPTNPTNPSNPGSGVTPDHSQTPIDTSAFDLSPVKLVDEQASPATKSLFAYLNNVRGEAILFGQQHATTEGVTITANDGTQSDVFNDVGAFPAVFGWDTLSLEGNEKPGSLDVSPEENTAKLAAVMKKAYERGGIVTLSAHMKNFVTGNDFYDTSGSVVSHILPGGDKNAEYNIYLDQIADLAHQLSDDQGNDIPVIFRPFHENNGNWFWWGAAFTSKEQYVQLYRYTVEYLRDTKGVDNFLYAFSPNGFFSGNESEYLKTYPGDDYVDILGFDIYGSAEGSEGWFTKLVQDAAMISRIADSKNKVATLSEFGYSTKGMKISGNHDKAWFTNLLKALESDPDAKRMAYMLTWVNFEADQVFVPYRNAPGGLGNHELLDDFVKLYNAPYTAFNDRLQAVYSLNVSTQPNAPRLNIVSPLNQQQIKENEVTVRARVLGQSADRVVYTVGQETEEHEMILSTQDNYYTAAWHPDSELDQQSVKLHVKAYVGDKIVMQDEVVVNFNFDASRLYTYTFDSDTNGVSSGGAFQAEINSVEQAEFNGSGMLKINAKFEDGTHTWQELKLTLDAIAQKVKLADVSKVTLDMYVPLSAGVSSAPSIYATATLPDDWNTKYNISNAVALGDLEKVTVDGVDYGKYTGEIVLDNPEKSAAATSMMLSIVGSGLQYTGPIYVDNIQLIHVKPEPIFDKDLMDDYESYAGNDTTLSNAYTPNAQGDMITIKLTQDQKGAGEYGLQYDYALSSSGYGGITRVMDGADWSDRDTLRLWLAPDGKGQKLVLQVKASGVSFEAYPSLAGTEAGWVEIPFSQFKPAPWDTANAGAAFDAVKAKNIQEFSIYINATDPSQPVSGTLYMDDIRAISKK
ncbi:mannan endo-1,4-beta-mannosidase [Paenibacillus amylolyticus]|uniref:Mannan endo-1,4-beta-mannosidase n=1 Tax=Paenibacillus amylolyticus TaxID=1451 RepID=A0AAP5LL32_PAEAM|nr:glycosyl hydrolase [Paenibacillus amylolyticus]MDR6722962.1 mannan endo-1,4-beta-mannosidase [Paenibacillus amylolyticus]